MKFKYRNKCVITGKDDLEHLVTVKKLPVFIGCTNEAQENDLKENLEVYISRSSGIIQLKKLLPLDVVYNTYHSEAVGSLWEEHNQEFSKFILKNIKVKKIIEIGGSNGKLAKTCINIDDELNWIIIEPNPEKKEFEEKNISLITSFIEDRLDLITGGQTIIHSHTLEHLYEPLSFFETLSKKSQKDDVMIFSIPDLYNYLKKNFVNTINFEHTYFITDEVADFLIHKAGYELIDKYYFNEHSIFYAIKFVGLNKISQNNLSLNKYIEYKKMYLNFIDYIDREVVRINRYISNYISKNDNPKIYLFGAHIFSQFLINRGLQTTRLKAIIDNSPKKIGKRLYGTNLNVINPKDLKNTNSLVILKAGQYQEEVEKQLNQISANIEFVL